jgi:hypothetical protein
VAATLRLVLALVAYVLLALLAWRTMAADKIRLVTFAVLGMLALRTIVQAARLKREAAEEQKHERETQS